MINESDLHCIQLKYGQQARSFWLPKTENQMAIATGIFDGSTFPHAPVDFTQIDCVFDIGANIGASTLYFHLTYPNAVVHAFEPNGLSFPILMKNVANLPMVKAHRYGLSNRDATLEMVIGGGGGEFSSVKKGLLARDAEIIQVKNAGPIISDLAKGKNLIVLKVDTEGCDAEILESLDNVYERVPVVYVEYHSEKQRRRVDRVLTGNGMLVFAARSHGPYRGDLTYVREEIIEAIPELVAYRAD